MAQIELLYRYKRAKTSRITALNIQKLYLYFVYFKLYLFLVYFKLYLYFVYFKLYVYFGWSPPVVLKNDVHAKPGMCRTCNLLMTSEML